MIDFKEKNFLGKSGGGTEAEFREQLQIHTERIQQDLKDAKTNFFYLGVHLTELYTSDAYSVYPCDREQIRLDYGLAIGAGNCCASFFFAYCFDTFGLDKTQVGRLMNIVNEFGDGFRGFKKRWENFGYSQLVEILPLSDAERQPVKSDWTVKRIREYKKSLVATSQQEKMDLPETESPPDKYVRFEKWTKSELCDKIFELEAENETLLKEIETLKTVSYEQAG